MLEVWLAVLAGAAFWIAAIMDVFAVDELDVCRLSKSGWIAIVMFVPVIGATVWLRAGRGTYKPFPAHSPNGYPPFGGQITGMRPGR